jgi:hypothetical protein
VLPIESFIKVVPGVPLPVAAPPCIITLPPASFVPWPAPPSSVKLPPGLVGAVVPVTGCKKVLLPVNALLPESVTRPVSVIKLIIPRLIGCPETESLANSMASSAVIANVPLRLVGVKSDYAVVSAPVPPTVQVIAPLTSSSTVSVALPIAVSL